MKTENEKLTLADAMKYPNAFVNYKNNLNHFGNLKCLKVRSYGKANNTLTCQYLSPSNEEELEVQDCKLILRPLSSLTDAEKEELAKWLPSKPNIVVSIRHLLAYCNSRICLIDYLRSINIDIDNFKKQGKAIYE